MAANMQAEETTPHGAPQRGGGLGERGELAQAKQAKIEKEGTTRTTCHREILTHPKQEENKKREKKRSQGYRE